MAKGSGFEREIAKAISLWWTEGERDDVIWRTQTSGARATARAKRGKSTAGQHGDLTYTDPIAKPLFDCCTIELKRGYGKWSVLDLVDKPAQGARQPIEKWIVQAAKERQAAAVPWALIIAKRDRRRPIIIYSAQLENKAALIYGGLRIPRLRFQCYNSWWITRLDDFLNRIPPTFFKMMEQT